MASAILAKLQLTEYMDVAAVVAISLKLLYAFNDRKENGAVSPQIVKNLKDRIEKLEKLEDSESSLVEDLQNLLYNL